MDVASLWRNNDFGVNLVKEFTDPFVALGGEVVSVTPYNAKQSSYASEVTAAMAVPADALYLISDPVDGATIARTWISQGGVQKFLLNDGMNSDDFIASVGKEYLGEAYGTSSGTNPTASTDYFNANYKDFSGIDPAAPAADAIEHFQPLDPRIDPVEDEHIIGIGLKRLERGIAHWRAIGRVDRRHASQPDQHRVQPAFPRNGERGDPLMQARQDGAGAMALDRSLDDGQVRRYLLLDRRDQNNCPLPISYAVPDQRALGRNLMPAQPDVGVPPAPPAPRP